MSTTKAAGADKHVSTSCKPPPQLLTNEDEYNFTNSNTSQYVATKLAISSEITQVQGITNTEKWYPAQTNKQRRDRRTNNKGEGNEDDILKSTRETEIFTSMVFRT